MPTFTGETGARIRDMEARLAALEAGGGIAPKTGLFRAYRYFEELSHPGGNLLIINDANSIELSNQSWYNTTTGRYTPQVQGWYRLGAGVTFKSPVPANAVTYGLHIENIGGGSFNTNVIIKRLQYIPVYGYKASEVVLSGSCIVYANGIDTSFQPAAVLAGAAGVILPYQSKTYFEGELIGAI